MKEGALRVRGQPCVSLAALRVDAAPGSDGDATKGPLDAFGPHARLVKFTPSEAASVFKWIGCDHDYSGPVWANQLAKSSESIHRRHDKGDWWRRRPW